MYICIRYFKARPPKTHKIQHIWGGFLFLDVDAPYDLAASNIQTESGMLTWKPPRADITGYILSFESTDGTVRVSIHKNVIVSGIAALLYHKSTNYAVKITFLNDFSSRRWSWVLLLSLITWLNLVPPQSIQWNCRLLLVLREAESSPLSSPPVSRFLFYSRDGVKYVSIWSVFFVSLHSVQWN